MSYTAQSAPTPAPQPTGWSPMTPSGLTGFTNWGMNALNLIPSYVPFLNTPQVAPGYLPSSGSYNQWALDRPGLFGTIAGTPSNMQYGSGGVGDPTTGREAQTPQEWVQGGKLFEWDTNMEGPLGYIGNLFGRSDTPSGIGTPTWGAPRQYWAGLAEQVAAGRVRPTARGWEALAAKGFTPQGIGGAAPQQAAAVGAQGVRGPGGGGTLPPGTAPGDVNWASGAGTAGGGGGASSAGGPSGEQSALASIAASNAADQAARLVFSEWTMRVGDERLAQEKAQQAWQQTFETTRQNWLQQYQTAGLTGTLGGQPTLEAQQQAFAQQVARAGLTGMYEGAPTQQAIAQQNQTGLGLLGLQSQLQGPRDAFRYQALNANTPGGLKDMLAGLAGRYNFAGSAGQGTPGAATLQSRTQDLLSGGQQGTGGAAQDGQSQFALPSPNQVNLANWGRLSPSGQQMALGAYESQGYYGADVEEALRRAAPRYTTGGGQAQLGL